MDKSFIRLMAKSYVYDNDITEESIDVYTNLAVNQLQYLKENEYEIYELLHSYTKSSQQDVLYRMFNIEEVAQELLALTAGLAPFFLIFYGNEYGALLLDKFDSFITNFRTTISDFIKDKEGATRLKTIMNIVDKNFDNCRQKCGMSSEASKDFASSDERVKYLLNKKANGGKSLNVFEKIFGTPNKIDSSDTLNAECLLSCYIGYITSVFAELLYSYNQCLIKTGEQIDLSKGVDVFSSFPTGSSCKTLKDHILSLYEDFNDLLKVFYKDNPRLEQDIVNMMDTKIKSVKSGYHVKTNIMIPTIEFKPKHIQL